MPKNPKNSFYRKLKLTKEVREIISAFRKIKKKMMKDLSKESAGK